MSQITQPDPDPCDATSIRDVESKETHEAGRFITILPQILASWAKNLIIIESGIAFAFPTIVIPVLRGLQNARNPDETLSFSDEQASWLGSIAFLSQPFGSILSGFLTDPIGRKKTMILFNIPLIIAWALLVFAKSSEVVFVATLLMGFGIGLMEAPVFTYVGEISQPNIRGILIACTGIAYTLGYFIVFLLGTITTWRCVALLCAAWPLVTMAAISCVPETPIWLLSKKRDAEALRSLQWLRGWVSPKAVEFEFNGLKRYHETSDSCVACYKASVKCCHPPPGLRERIREIPRKRTMRPFAIIVFCFLVAQFNGLIPIRAYLIQILKAFAIPIDANLATVIVGAMQFLGNIVCMTLIKVLGKRRLFFISLSGSALCCFGLGLNAFNVLPAGLSSFDKHEISNEMANSQENYFAMMTFLAFTVFATTGVVPLPWILLSEMFPFKTRGIATGWTAVVANIITFVSIKTYLNLETTLKLSWTMFFYGGVNIIGLCGIYFLLPETEGRTLEEIELFFSDHKRGMLDRNTKKTTEDISLGPIQTIQNLQKY